MTPGLNKNRLLQSDHITNSVFLFPFDIYFLCGEVIAFFTDLVIGSWFQSSTIQIIRLFNISFQTWRSALYSNESYAAVFMYWHKHIPTIQNILRGESHWFQSNQPKTRKNIFHFVLPVPLNQGSNSGPFRPELFVCLAIWANTSNSLTKKDNY